MYLYISPQKLVLKGTPHQVWLALKMLSNQSNESLVNWLQWRLADECHRGRKDR